MKQTWAEQSLLDRMVTAVERVRDRLKRTAAALKAAGVDYAVVGGNAVAAWVAAIDPTAVRNTQDVDILLRRSDLDAATQATEAAGFVRHEVMGVEMFLDGPTGGPKDAVHLLFAGEKVRPTSLAPAPDVTESAKPDDFRLLDLEALVLRKLTSFHRKDQVHLLDLLGVGLLDASWAARFPAALAARLQTLVDTPEE